MNKRVPYYFTYVTYPQHDFLGYLMAIVSLTPQILSIVLASFIISVPWSLKMHLVRLLFGQIVNEAINIILKHWFKTPRSSNERIDYAMPSSHSQYAGYISVAGWFTFKKMNLDGWMVALGRLCLIGVYTLVPFSRFYLDYHDASQVLTGLAFGTVFGWFWKRTFLIVK
jgi:membrane-associated phospholipid phosphatase